MQACVLGVCRPRVFPRSSARSSHPPSCSGHCAFKGSDMAPKGLLQSRGLRIGAAPKAGGALKQPTQGLHTSRHKLATQLAKIEERERRAEEANLQESLIREILEELRKASEKVQRAQKLILGDFLTSTGGEDTIVVVRRAWAGGGRIVLRGRGRVSRGQGLEVQCVSRMAPWSTERGRVLCSSGIDRFSLRMRRSVHGAKDHVQE